MQVQYSPAPRTQFRGPGKYKIPGRGKAYQGIFPYRSQEDQIVPFEVIGCNQSAPHNPNGGVKPLKHGGERVNGHHLAGPSVRIIEEYGASAFEEGRVRSDPAGRILV